MKEEDNDPGPKKETPSKEAPEEFVDDSKRGAEAGEGTKSDEYPSSSGSDETPQEPATEESSDAPRPETESGTSESDEDESSTGRHSG